MIETIYIEEEVADHPRTRAICRRFAHAERVSCGRYGEIFNRRAQNFRLQKRRPALIIARKFDNHVLDAPEAYGIGGSRNYYFSHMLNCIYDCRYCFLQGMFQSAHYVVFVNYEDFMEEIERKVAGLGGEEAYFFSGYDCDSLALESVTGFAREFLPFFERLEGAWLELRTKSVQTNALRGRAPFERCIVAFSLTPDEIGRALEHGAPPLGQRLEAMANLQRQGWKLGLRFDPLIYTEDFERQYRGLFERVFSVIDAEALHSVSLGPFRLPREMYKTMSGLYPEEPLFAGPLGEQGTMVSYRREIEQRMMEFCEREILSRVAERKFFSATAAMV